MRVSNNRCTKCPLLFAYSKLYLNNEIIKKLVVEICLYYPQNWNFGNCCVGIDQYLRINIDNCKKIW